MMGAASNATSTVAIITSRSSAAAAVPLLLRHSGRAGMRRMRRSGC